VAGPNSEVSAFATDLETLHDALCASESRLIARGRLRHIRYAVAVFGFHLASLDLRSAGSCDRGSRRRAVPAVMAEA
jgi:phosphoenolpyruvate carboxylase